MRRRCATCRVWTSFNVRRGVDIFVAKEMRAGEFHQDRETTKKTASALI